MNSNHNEYRRQNKVTTSEVWVVKTKYSQVLLDLVHHIENGRPVPPTQNIG